MGHLYINWRFGTRHLQIGPSAGRWGISFRVNQYHLDKKPAKWFQRYQ